MTTDTIDIHGEDRPMSAQELLDAFPTCHQAVSWVELILCSPNGHFQQTAWEILTCARSDGTLPTPAEVASMIIDDMARELREAIEPRPGYAQAYRQMQHPAFLVYLRGKMGCV